MADLEKRIDQLEKLTGPKKPIFFFFVYDGSPEPTPEIKERLCQEAVQKDPGQKLYFIYPPYGYSYQPPQEPPGQNAQQEPGDLGRMDFDK